MFDFTPSEKRTLSSLVLVICIAGVIQFIKPMSVGSNQYDYSQADSIFQRKSQDYFNQERSDSGNITGKQENKSGHKNIFSTVNKKSKNIPAPKMGTVDLNLSSAAELETLPHIGPAMAARIVEFRKTNEKFRSVRDLKKVKGIGDKTFESISPYFKIVR